MSSSDAFVEFVNRAGVSLCVGCRVAERCTLGIEREELHDDILVVDVTCPSERQGVQGVAHGGWIADTFDEVLGKRLQLAGEFGVTRELNVRFCRPTPAGVALVATAWVNQADEQNWVINGDLRVAATSSLLAEGSVTMVLRDSERHIQRFKAWRTSDEERAIPG